MRLALFKKYELFEKKRKHLTVRKFLARRGGMFPFTGSNGLENKWHDLI